MLNYVESPGLPRGLSFEPDAGDRVAIWPLGLIAGEAGADAASNGLARPLTGGRLFYTACRVFVERAGTVSHRVAPPAAVEDWAASVGGALDSAIGRVFASLSGPRPAFSGLTLDRARVVGIVNVTPDSFFDGGRHAATDAAIAHGEALVAAGADIIDIGGESTRPGSDATPGDVERERVLPVVRALSGGGALVSIDTRRADVMSAALEAGARVINDVTALRDDPKAAALVTAAGAHVVLMHMRGRPRSMQAAPRYGDVAYEVWRFLADRVEACTRAGIPIARIAVDPGIGFGKTDAHNLRLLSAAAMLHATGTAVMVGASRKSFIGRIFEDVPAEARLAGSLAAAMTAVGQGVQLLRVHDVAETRQALAVIEGVSADAPP